MLKGTSQLKKAVQLVHKSDVGSKAKNQNKQCQTHLKAKTKDGSMQYDSDDIDRCREKLV